MSDDNADTSRERLPAKGSKGTGYKKPPTASQFPPGKSGNPAGRPLGAKNKLPAFGLEHVRSTILAELRELITVPVGETTITLPVLTAILRKVTDRATSGDMRAAHMILTMAQEIEAQDREFYERFSLRAMIFIGRWEEACARTHSHGHLLLPPFPFEHLSVNRGTGQVEIHGPIPFEKPDQIEVRVEAGHLIPHGDQKGWNMAEVEDPIAIARWFMTIMELPDDEEFEDYLP